MEKIFSKHLRDTSRILRPSYNKLKFGVWTILLRRWTRISTHENFAYIGVAGGVWILPKDGSYIRYISNAWYITDETIN